VTFICGKGINYDDIPTANKRYTEDFWKDFVLILGIFNSFQRIPYDLNQATIHLQSSLLVSCLFLKLFRSETWNFYILIFVKKH